MSPRAEYLKQLIQGDPWILVFYGIATFTAIGVFTAALISSIRSDKESISNAASLPLRKDTDHG
jgi:hypothetical protein